MCQQKIILHQHKNKWIALIISLFFSSGALALNVSGLPVDIQGLDSRQQAQLEKIALSTLQKINAVINEIDQLNKSSELKNPSAQLLELLNLCNEWQVRTDNKFTCRLGAVQRDWQIAADVDVLPDRAVLRRKARRHLQLEWSADHQFVRFNAQAKAEGLQIDLQGLWEGWVITQLAPVVCSQGATNIIYGKLHQQCGENDSSELIRLKNSEPVVVTLPRGKILAIVDRAENIRKVDHHSLNRILIPDEGWPVEFAPSLLVRATNAIEADVMAHALLVVSGYQALAKADKNPDIAILEITENGNFFASKLWYANNFPIKTPWPEMMKFQVDFEIPELDVAEYRRPYVALWISDDKGEIIRPLFTSGENTRWLQELRQWWRKFGRNDPGLVDMVAGATRRPGKYHLEWDGRDLHGQMVSAGNYVLHAEIAREHGERELMSLPFLLSGQSLKLSAQGKHELGLVTLDLH